MEKRQSIRRIFLASFSFLFVTNSLISMENTEKNKLEDRSDTKIHMAKLDSLKCRVVNENGSYTVYVGNYVKINKQSTDIIEITTTEKSIFHPSKMIVNPKDIPKLIILNEETLPRGNENEDRSYGTKYFLWEIQNNPCPLSIILNKDYYNFKNPRSYRRMTLKKLYKKNHTEHLKESNLYWHKLILNFYHTAIQNNG